MIYENLDRTRLKDKAIVINKDYEKCLKQLSNDKIKFNIIYIDPPYKANIAVNATEKILLLNLLQKEGIIIIETDEKLMSGIPLKNDLSKAEKNGRQLYSFGDEYVFE